MSQSVIQHVLRRLTEIGLTDVFGVPGDFAFPVNDAICAPESGLRWIGTANELNAGYAADGYARVRGFSAVCTTYGVGELAALAAIAGAYAEHVPLFHLVGMPNMAVQASRSLMHHTLGNGEFNLFHQMSQPVVCASAILTPQNAAYETERLIAEALMHRRPVYMGFPADYASQPVLGKAAPIPEPRSDPAALEAALVAILAELGAAKSACILPGTLAARLGLQNAIQAIVDASGLPFATMFMDKTMLDESQPGYLGIYIGKLMNEAVRVFVEGCDRILTIGTMMTDFNSGFFTARLDPERVIAIHHHHVTVRGHVIANVEMADILAALAPRLTRGPLISVPAAEVLGDVEGAGDAPITAAALYPRWERFLREGDIVVADTGTVSMGLGFARMPKGATFYNQSLWGAIGWATPAALGAALAAPERRTVLVTGEGAHQFTVQELGQFGRFGLKPVIFVLNNDGYLIERLLCRDPTIGYNDIAQWKYAQLPEAFGCEGWFSARVTTCGELDAAMERAARGDVGAYIEIVTDAYMAPELPQRMHENVAKMYKQ
jgi:indolepyruvate decarboxylase